MRLPPCLPLGASASPTSLRNVTVPVTTAFERLGFHKSSRAATVLERGQRSWLVFDLSRVWQRRGFQDPGKPAGLPEESLGNPFPPACRAAHVAALSVPFSPARGLGAAGACSAVSNLSLFRFQLLEGAPPCSNPSRSGPCNRVLLLCACPSEHLFRLLIVYRLVRVFN